MAESRRGSTCKRHRGLRQGRVEYVLPVVERASFQTARLLLRPFQADDVADALAYRNDPEFARFLPHIPRPFTRRDAEAFVALNMSEPWERSPRFAVVFQKKVVGTVSFEVHAASRVAMIGYAIGRHWWGQGIAVEAAQAAMAWAIATFGLHRVWASTDTRHARSRRVLEKLGMQRETIRVSDQVGRDGTRVDEVVYGLTIQPSPAEVTPP
jgi:[ribosomal protein S5]-alanine N-acetyltransferase